MKKRGGLIIQTKIFLFWLREQEVFFFSFSLQLIEENTWNSGRFVPPLVASTSETVYAKQATDSHQPPVHGEAICMYTFDL